MNYKKSLFILFLFLFIFPFVSFAKEKPQVVFINQMRGEECCAKGTLDNLKMQTDAFIKYSIPAYFVLRYDALINKKYVDFLKQQLIKYPVVIKLGLMIEITPQLAKDARVKYKEKETTWFEAQNAFTIGYSPSERKKLVDLLFKKFRETFNYYPSLTSAWMIDITSLNYINKQYGVKVHQITREQQETDSYTLYGGPPHYPYPASYKWLLIPDYQRGNAPLIVRQTVTDPVYNFGDKTSAFTSQPNDYASDGKTFDYFETLVYQTLFNQPEDQVGFALLGLENSMDLRFQEEYLKQIDYIASLKKDDRIIFPDINQLKTFWPEKKITVYYGKDFINNVDKFVYWISAPQYRLRLIIDKQLLSISDLRIYDKNLTDPYLKAPTKKGGRWIIPQKDIADIYGKITLSKIENRNSLRINLDDRQNFIFNYADEKGKTIILENKFGKMVDMTNWLYPLISVFIVSLISLVGIFALTIKANRLTDILIYSISFSAGALFGDVFIHLLPEVVKKSPFDFSVSSTILAGIVISFFVEKIICWRHCHLPVTKTHVHRFAYMNIFGDSIHNFIDGLIIGASYLVSLSVGIATTVAVILHEIPQEIGDFGVLLHAGMTKNKALLYNFLTALTAFLGVISALLLATKIEGATNLLSAFASGSFIYIAGSDLIPELHKETALKKGLIQIFTFILGIAIMYSLLLVG